MIGEQGGRVRKARGKKEEGRERKGKKMMRRRNSRELSRRDIVQAVLVYCFTEEGKQISSTHQLSGVCLLKLSCGLVEDNSRLSHFSITWPSMDTGNYLYGIDMGWFIIA